MKRERIQQIKNNLEVLGTKKAQLYTQQEIIDKLYDLEEGMTETVFATGHAEHFQAKDVMLHIASLANEYGLQGMEEYQRLEKNMRLLGYKIASLITGQRGEQNTKRALKILELDPEVEVLYNIVLQEEEFKTEYDAIVLTPYGVFVLEVKNFNSAMCITERGIFQKVDNPTAKSYNLGERMNCKEYLIRKKLGEALRVPYQGMVLFANEKAALIDDYKKIPITYSNTVTSDIQSYCSECEERLTREEIQELAEILINNNVPCKFPCEIDCEQIIDDFAVLIAEIEAAADEAMGVQEIENTDMDDSEEKKSKIFRCVAKGLFEILKLGVAGGIGIGVGMYISTHTSN